MKLCKSCNQQKPYTEFYAKSKLGSLRSECKLCWNARTKQWDMEHPERRKEIRQGWDKNNPDHNKAWYLRHPEKYLYQTAKQRAKKRNIEFTISLADIVIPESCPVLGMPMAIFSGDKQRSPS